MCTCKSYYCIDIGVARVLFLFSFSPQRRLDAVLLATLLVCRGRSSTSLATELVNGTRFQRLALLLLFIPPPVRTSYIYYLFFFFWFQNGRVSTVCCLERASAKCCHVSSLIKPIPIRLISARFVHFTWSSLARIRRTLDRIRRVSLNSGKSVRVSRVNYINISGNSCCTVNSLGLWCVLRLNTIAWIVACLECWRNWIATICGRLKGPKKIIYVPFFLRWSLWTHVRRNDWHQAASEVVRPECWSSVGRSWHRACVVHIRWTAQRCFSFGPSRSRWLVSFNRVLYYTS